jgi:hypothetical protein
MSKADLPGDLETRYLFIDTSVYRRLAFDWTGRTLHRLSSLIDQRHIILVVTEITIREMKSNIKEMGYEALKPIRRWASFIRRMGGRVPPLDKEADLIEGLEKEIDRWHKDRRAIIVGADVNLRTILEDYFLRRPPFSDKKKAEFPDAIVVSQLKQWCLENESSIYVASDDIDMKECCEPGGALIFADITKVISLTQASEEFHSLLFKTLRQDDELASYIMRAIENAPIVVESRSSRDGVGTAYNPMVTSIRLFKLAIEDRTGDFLRCDIEVMANVELEVDIDFGITDDGIGDTGNIHWNGVGETRVRPVAYVDLKITNEIDMAYEINSVVVDDIIKVPYGFIRMKTSMHDNDEAS